MRKFGLIGYPLGHSFSKKYFTEKFQKEQISDCIYDNYPLSDISFFPEMIRKEPDLYGLNVTIPYKSEILGYLNVIDDEAAEIGAVNVLKIKRTGGEIVICGFNSDVTGFRDSLLPFINSSIKNAVVLGTGGSSRAVCYVLNKLGMKVTLVSRNKKTGISEYSDLNSELIDNTDLIVNTTPLGMYPNIESVPAINYELLSKKHILFDLVYNPELTSFLREGKKHGCTIVSGLKMLHSQAELSWKIWNDANL
jgi:shikimate dehydrogenase